MGLRLRWILGKKGGKSCGRAKEQFTNTRLAIQLIRFVGSILLRAVKVRKFEDTQEDKMCTKLLERL